MPDHADLARANARVLDKLTRLYLEAFNHDGFAEIRVETRILCRNAERNHSALRQAVPLRRRLRGDVTAAGRSFRLGRPGGWGLQAGSAGPRRIHPGLFRIFVENLEAGVLWGGGPNPFSLGNRHVEQTHGLVQDGTSIKAASQGARGLRARTLPDRTRRETPISPAVFGRGRR